MKRALMASAITMSCVVANGAHSTPDDSEPAIPGIRVLETHPPSKTHSEPPKSWKDSVPVALARPLPRTCKATLLREWLRIRCAGIVDGLAELAGNTGSVGLSTRPPDWPNNKSGEVELVVPIRYGERRFMQVLGDEWAHHTGALTLSIQWLPDQPGPWVVLNADSAYFLGGD